VATGPVRFGSNKPNMLASTYVLVYVCISVFVRIYIWYALIIFEKKSFFKLKNILGVKKKGQFLVFPFLYLPFFFWGGGRGWGLHSYVDKSTKGKESFRFFFFLFFFFSFKKLRVCLF